MLIIAFLKNVFIGPILAKILRTNIGPINAFFKNAIINNMQKIKLTDGKTKILKLIPLPYIKICGFSQKIT